MFRFHTDTPSTVFQVTCPTPMTGNLLQNFEFLSADYAVSKTVKAYHNWPFTLEEGGMLQHASDHHLLKVSPMWQVLTLLQDLSPVLSHRRMEK